MTEKYDKCNFSQYHMILCWNRIFKLFLKSFENSVSTNAPKVINVQHLLSSTSKLKTNRESPFNISKDFSFYENRKISYSEKYVTLNCLHSYVTYKLLKRFLGLRDNIIQTHANTQCWSQVLQNVVEEYISLTNFNWLNKLTEKNRI